MSWFERKKNEPSKEELAKRDERIREMLDYHEAELFKTLPAAKDLGVRLHDVDKMTKEQKFAYASKLAELFKAQEGLPYVGIKRQANVAMELDGGVHSTLEQVLIDLGVTHLFPQQEGRNAIEEPPSIFDKPLTERAEPLPENPYQQAFERLYQFLLQKLDRKQPIPQQVSRLVDAADLRKIDPNIISTLMGDKTMWEGNEKEIRARIKGALIARLNSEQR